MVYKAHFLNVGCADCTIFEIGSELVMIDCGYRRFSNGVSKPTAIYDYLKYVIKNTHIDLLIITHPHHDHYLGLKDLYHNITVDEFWGSPYERRYGDGSLSNDEWNEYCDLKAQVVSNINNRYIPSKGIKKTIGCCTITVLGPRKDVNDRKTRECHDASLVLCVSSPANTLIICGDASDSELDEVNNDYQLSACTILKASHHGSLNGANLDFIKSASPRDTIISTKSGIFENVPSNTALQRYRVYSTNIFRTDTDGTCTAPLIT